MVQSGTKAGALFNTNADANIGIGISGSSLVNPFTGSCAAFRPTIGTARYNTNGSYTVPPRPLPTS